MYSEICAVSLVARPIRHRIFRENPRCRIEKTYRSAQLTYTFYSNII